MGPIARVLKKILPEKIMHRAVKFSGALVVLCTRAIQANIFRDFSGHRRPIFNCFYIIRFVFPLAFQRRIRNCSTAKTREDIAKRKRKVENDGSVFLTFFGFV